VCVCSECTRFFPIICCKTCRYIFHPYRTRTRTGSGHTNATVRGGTCHLGVQPKSVTLAGPTYPTRRAPIFGSSFGALVHRNPGGGGGGCPTNIHRTSNSRTCYVHPEAVSPSSCPPYNARCFLCAALRAACGRSRAKDAGDAWLESRYEAACTQQLLPSSVTVDAVERVPSNRSESP